VLDLQTRHARALEVTRELPTGIRFTFDELTCKVNGYQSYVWRQDPTRKRGGYQTSRRWPLSATIAEMVAWRTEQEMHGKRPELFVDDGRQKLIFVTEARFDYLQREKVRKMPTYAERKQHIEKWIAVFGHRERPTITRCRRFRRRSIVCARGSRRRASTNAAPRSWICGPRSTAATRRTR
jgi:hypothetical protein